MLSKADRPPEDLPAWAKELWRDSLEALREQETWRDENWPQLEFYVRSVVRYAKALEERKGELTSTGVGGQMREHPLIKVERQAYQDAEQCAIQLLLSPRARRQAEVAASGSGDEQSVLDSLFSQN